MINYTHKENQNMMSPLTVQAHEVGLLTGTDRLVYEKGGRGTATVIRVVRLEENGHRVSQMRPMWVPEFGYKDGPSIVGNSLVQLSNVFYALMKMKEDAARAEKQVWSG